MNTKENKILLKIKNISKTFPGVKALEKIDLELEKGEVLGLVGENGAGKSTIMKILAGVYKPDPNEGEIYINGEFIEFNSPSEAKEHGILMIFQELSLVLGLSIAENIFLGSLPKNRFGLVNYDLLYKNTKAVLELIECDFRPEELVGNLPIAKRQLVEIARALALHPNLIIFDEPTSSLPKIEVDILFRCISRLKERDIGIVYISHKLDEILTICDRIEVLRDGKNAGSLCAKDTNISEITRKMIGRSIKKYYHKSKSVFGDEMIRVENLTVTNHFYDVNLNILRGEVVGLYGLVGAGRTEIAETIFGIRNQASGNIVIEGKPININNSSDAVKIGIGLVTEDRKQKGLILGMSCEENIGISKLPWIINKLGVIDRRQLRDLYIEYKEKLNIISPSPNQKVLYLSGGNQQKIVISKWLATSPNILILDEPTRGIDVGSKAEIHKIIAELANSGMAILVISSEMPEIIGLCNRIITISEGRITAEFKDEEISERNIIESITVSNSRIAIN